MWVCTRACWFGGHQAGWEMRSKWFAKGRAEETGWMLWGHKTEPTTTWASEQGCSTFIPTCLCVTDMTYPNPFLRCQESQLEILPWLHHSALQLCVILPSSASPTGYRTWQLQDISSAWALKASVPDLSVSLTFLIILILRCRAQTDVSNYSRYDLQ